MYTPGEHQAIPSAWFYTDIILWPQPRSHLILPPPIRRPSRVLRCQYTQIPQIQTPVTSWQLLGKDYSFSNTDIVLRRGATWRAKDTGLARTHAENERAAWELQIKGRTGDRRCNLKRGVCSAKNWWSERTIADLLITWSLHLIWLCGKEVSTGVVPLFFLDHSSLLTGC